MNNDVISRSALTERIVDLLVFHWGYEGVEADVKQIFSEIPAVDAGPKWISVEDRLPEHGDEVLVVLEVHSLLGKTNTRIATAVFTPPKWWAIADYDTGFVTATDETDVEVNRHRITYWMPLPEPPKEG